MPQNVTTLGKFINHVKAVDNMFIDNYFVVMSDVNDYYINCNGFNQLNNDSLVAFNNVNGTWYFKVVG